MTYIGTIVSCLIAIFIDNIEGESYAGNYFSSMNGKKIRRTDKEKYKMYGRG